MNRYLKVIGLALAAALALSAVLAAGASAQTNHKLTTSGKPTFITTKAHGTHLLGLNTNDANKFFSCNEVTATTTIENEAEEFAAKPSYSSCEIVDGETKVSAFPDFTGCEYVFTAKTTEGNPTGGHHAESSRE